MLSWFQNPARRWKKTPEGKLVSILRQSGVDTVLDVGANIGQTGDRLRRAGYAGLIVSFEPVPDAHERLSRRAVGDPLWLVAPRMALGDRVGDITMNISQATSMSSVLNAGADLLSALPTTVKESEVTTPISTVDAQWDSYCTPESRVLLKVDTQGSERPVLNGAVRSIPKLAGIQLELSLLELYEGEETYLGFLNDLHGWGFVPHMIWETYFSRRLNRQLQIDVVFMRAKDPSLSPRSASR